VNLGSKRARIVEENINMEDWEKHFLKILKVEKGTGKETGEKRRMEGNQEEELGEEFQFQLKKIKKKKATEFDVSIREA